MLKLVKVNEILVLKMCAILHGLPYATGHTRTVEEVRTKLEGMLMLKFNLLACYVTLMYVSHCLVSLLQP